MPTILLRKFREFRECAMNSNIVIIGGKCMGKSILANDLLSRIGLLDKNDTCGLIISPIASELFVGNCNIEAHTTHYSESIVSDFVSRQINKVTASFIVLDNCMENMKWTNHEVMELLFSQKKQIQNLHMTVIITMPCLLSLPQLLRANVDFVFVLKTHNQTRWIYNEYGSAFQRLEIFSHTLTESTICPGDCLVINNNILNDTYDQIAWWYRVEV